MKLRNNGWYDIDITKLTDIEFNLVMDYLKACDFEDLHGTTRNGKCLTLFVKSKSFGFYDTGDFDSKTTFKQVIDKIYRICSSTSAV